MLVQTHIPKQISEAAYDRFLAEGWFRGSSLMYKMDMVCMDEDVHSVVNIRLPLDGFFFRRRHQKILKRNDARFFTVAGHAAITPEAEALYQKQKPRLRGFVHQTLSEIFRDDFDSPIFPTRQISVYDGERLVALSFFDTGKNSMASLLCVHDPEYKNFSLGIYTILKEIELALFSEMRWYYPGYILDHTTSFDYKLEMGDFEWLDENHKWSALTSYHIEKTNGHELRQKLVELSTMLNDRGIIHTRKVYPHFVVAYTNQSNDPLLRYPAFLEIMEMVPGKKIIATYDLELKRNVVLEVRTGERLQNMVHLERAGDYLTSDAYCMELLMVDMMIDEF